MIDFRYHIVSLISVFLALAVGIILGAGPLKESIGDTLTGQVDQLRLEKEQMRTELEGVQEDNAHLNEYVSAASKRVAKESLEGRRIGVIQLGEITDERFESIEQQVTYAGATVSSRVTLGAGWTDPDQAATRVSLANSLVDMLPENKKDLTSEKALAAALIVALSEKSPTDADQVSANAELALTILDEAELVSLDRYTPAPVDAFIILDGSNVVSTDEDAAEPDFTAVTTLQMNVAEEAARSTEGAVVATENVVDTDLVSAIRSSASLLKVIATVSDVDGPMGQLNTPLALSAAIGKKVGHFGFESNATALVPAAVVLPEPDRSIVEPETTDAGAEADAEESN